MAGIEESADWRKANSESRLEFDRAYLDRVGDAVSLVVEGIPMEADTAEMFYGKEYQNLSHTFDYIDLHPDETAEATNQLLTTHHPHGGIETGSFGSRWVSKQRLQINELLPTVFKHRVIREVDGMAQIDMRRAKEMEVDFKNAVREKPEKPFLVVIGHGGQNLKFTLTPPFIEMIWHIGDRSGEMSTNLKKVFDRLPEGKYSAVLLISCNTRGIKPPELRGTPIYYVKGLAGGNEIYDRGEPHKRG